MKKVILSICFIVIVFVSHSVTESDLSGRITIDGYSADFTADENVLKDTLGNLLESPTDSYWGENNDVRQLKATWDEEFLYIAVDACSWGNNVMLMIDIFEDYGIEDMSEMNAWQRSFKFYNWNPDFFFGTWDTNSDPQFWKVTEGLMHEVVEVTGMEDAATFDTGNLDRSMEVKVPWDSLYYSDERNMLDNPNIRICSFITAGSDYTSGPDAAPDNLGGMANDSGQLVVIDNYAEILIDDDFDGLPDIGVEPNKRIIFLKRPPFKSLPLSITEVIFESGKTFATSMDEKVTFVLNTNRQSQFKCEVYDLNGKYIDDADPDLVVDQKWDWDGRKKNGKFVPFGIYILRFVADSNEVHHKEAVVVIK
jgi:hypothetical protein